MKILVVIFLIAINLTPSSVALAALGQGAKCRDVNGNPVRNSSGQVENCDSSQNLICLNDLSGVGFTCQPGSPATKAFGAINPPSAITNIGFGNLGISNFLNTLITLIYVIAGIIFLFMAIFSGFQWVMSGGDKEKVGNARARLTNAIIGIVLLALVFVVVKLVGQITGFEFFQGQNVTPQNLPSVPGSGRSIPF